ncbi:MAG: pyridoxal-phosphate dependent enzyme, partial [Acidobacteriota bacterium]
RSVSIADGLMTVRPGDLTLAHVRQFLDGVVTVEDNEIADAVLWLTDRMGIRAEPSGAATVAAALAGAGGPGPTVAIVSGGNVSLERIEELRRRD